MFYKNKDKTIDKMFEYLKDNFFDNELLLFHNFNDLNLNYNFETKKYLNENFIFQNINKIFLQNKISEIKNFEKKFNFLEFENFKQIFEYRFEKDLKKEFKKSFKNNLINKFNDFDNLKKLFSKKKNISKLSLKYSIDSINKTKFYNFFELNILENENFENLKKYKKEKKIFKDRYSFHILNLKNDSKKLKSLIKEKQKNINFINLKNQKILDENFKNISNNFIKLNFLCETKKNKIDIENMKIISQFPEYLNR